MDVSMERILIGVCGLLLSSSLFGKGVFIRIIDPLIGSTPFATQIIEEDNLVTISTALTSEFCNSCSPFSKKTGECNLEFLVDREELGKTLQLSGMGDIVFGQLKVTKARPPGGFEPVCKTYWLGYDDTPLSFGRKNNQSCPKPDRDYDDFTFGVIVCDRLETE